MTESEFDNPDEMMGYGIFAILLSFVLVWLGRGFWVITFYVPEGTRYGESTEVIVRELSVPVYNAMADIFASVFAAGGLTLAFFGILCRSPSAQVKLDQNVILSAQIVDFHDVAQLGDGADVAPVWDQRGNVAVVPRRDSAADVVVGRFDTVRGVGGSGVNGHRPSTLLHRVATHLSLTITSSLLHSVALYGGLP